MSGFFGFGAFRGGTILGNLLAKGGFFGPNFIPTPVTPPVTGSVFLMGGPNSRGPWNPLAGDWPFGSSNDFGAFSSTGATTNGGIYGSLDSGSGLIMGIPVEAIGYDGNNAFVLVLGPAGSLAQSLFTTLTVGAPVNLVLTSASADYFNSNDAVNGFPGYTVWAWARAPVVIFGSDVSVAAT